MRNLSAWPAFHFLPEALQTTAAHWQLGWGLGVKPRQLDRVGCSQGEDVLGTARNQSQVQGYGQPCEFGDQPQSGQSEWGVLQSWESVEERRSC